MYEQGIGDRPAGGFVGAPKTGILPNYDTFGGSMIPAQEDMAKRAGEDCAAISGYVKSLPPRPGRWKKTKSGVW